MVEDNPGDARMLTIGLAEEAGDVFNVEWVQDLASATERVSNAFFDAVVLDLNLPDSSGFQTYIKMRAAAAETPVLVLTGIEDDSVGLKAIQHGAQDYLAKTDLTGSIVSRALRYAVERHRSQVRELKNAQVSQRGKVVGFIGVKGGVGTTTLTLNIAAILAKNIRRSIIAAELRSDYGAFAAQLRESPDHSLADLLRLDLSTLSDSVLDKCIFRSRLGFDILFSPQHPNEFLQLAEEDVTQLTAYLAHRAAYTLVDLPNRFYPVTDAVLRECDLTVLVTERDPSSLAAAKVALEYIRSRESKSITVGLVVVNRSLMIDGGSSQQIESALRCELLGVVPPAPDVSVGAQKLGAPIALHRPHSAPTTMLTAITEKILKRLESSVAVPSSPRMAPV